MQVWRMMLAIYLIVSGIIWVAGPTFPYAYPIIEAPIQQGMSQVARDIMTPAVFSVNSEAPALQVPKRCFIVKFTASSLPINRERSLESSAPLKLFAIFAI